MIIVLSFFRRIYQDSYLYIFVYTTGLKLFELLTLNVNQGFWVKRFRDSLGFSVKKEVQQNVFYRQNLHVVNHVF